MKNGTDVAVLERGSKWSKIQYGSKIGYVMNSYGASIRSPPLR